MNRVYILGVKERKKDRSHLQDMWSTQEAAKWCMASRVVGEGENVVVHEANAITTETMGKSFRWRRS
jgi:hypothetical protein